MKKLRHVYKQTPLRGGKEETLDLRAHCTGPGERSQTGRRRVHDSLTRHLERVAAKAGPI